MPISLTDVTSGYSTGTINNNFQAIEEYINSNLLKRDGVEIGEANQMEVDLDMNGQLILNTGFDPNNPDSLLTLGFADGRYINTAGDTMQGPLAIQVPTKGTHPVQKTQLDSEINSRASADASLQAQLTGTAPLEASAFSEISWHGQVVQNSVTIPDGKNAWSFGPVMSIASGQSVTIGEGSYWTIAEGNGDSQLTYDGGVL